MCLNLDPSVGTPLISLIYWCTGISHVSWPLHELTVVVRVSNIYWILDCNEQVGTIITSMLKMRDMGSDLFSYHVYFLLN